ncbi:hypothetical protein AVEN_38293-1 [Araneus ventricosus]|uniref:Ubiquitin-like domain-containing protein n=1 Tax=Araneus ventricosus TaxID=182803 RepID=A0A4Y2E7U5_ARAVE|nr:hypothetical protein AVEN_38293-1 [Araneus ventricosus]
MDQGRKLSYYGITPCKPTKIREMFKNSDGGIAKNQEELNTYLTPPSNGRRKSNCSPMEIDGAITENQEEFNKFLTPTRNGRRRNRCSPMEIDTEISKEFLEERNDFFTLTKNRKLRNKSSPMDIDTEIVKEPARNRRCNRKHTAIDNGYGSRVKQNGLEESFSLVVSHKADESQGQENQGSSGKRAVTMTVLPINIPVESLSSAEPHNVQHELYIEFYYVDRVHIFITGNRRHYYMTMCENETVYDVMLKIQSDTERYSGGIHTDCQTLYKDGEVMDLFQPLSYFDIHPENTSIASPARLEISFKDSAAGTAVSCQSIWNKLLECPGINCL